MPLATRVFLGLEALVWLPYGVFCFVQPTYLAEAAGVAATTATGTVELQAMYGGLQAGLGVLAALAVMRADLARPALLALFFLAAGLGLARLFAALTLGGFSVYTSVALVFAWVTAAVAAALLARRGGEALAAPGR